MSSYVSNYDGTMVKVGDRFVSVYKGGAVPDGADPEHVKVLLDRGLLTEGEPASGVAADPGPPPFQAPGSGDSGDVPAKSANKAAWVDYAVSKGADRDEAEASTKDDLIATYGG